MAQNNTLPWVVAIAALLVVAFLAYKFVPAGQEHTITVNGVAELRVEPDKADLWLTAESTGATASDAQAKLETLSDKVIDALNAEGVSDDDIETTQFSVYPEYKWNPQTGENTLTGYKAQHSIKAEIHDLDEVGSIASAAGAAGALINYVQFGLTEEKQKAYDMQALQMATADAKSKASSLVTTAGGMLGKVISIQESGYGYPPFPYYARDAVMEAAAGKSSVEILPGEVMVTKSVTITYELR